MIIETKENVDCVFSLSGDMFIQGVSKKCKKWYDKFQTI